MERYSAGESDTSMDLKNFNLFSWLFNDVTTTNFRFYVPWLIVNIAALLIPLYYALEGRKRLDLPFESLVQY